MRAFSTKILSLAVLSLALVACGSDPEPTPTAKPDDTKVSQTSVQPASEQASSGQAASEQAPVQLDGQEMLKLTSEVFGRFKENFPQISDFTTPPVVVRIEPVAGVELFEIITPHGVFYTDRQASWIVEGVLFMPSPYADPSQAQATGLPTPMVNVTLRPDVQRIYGSIRDKEAGVRSLGGEKLSGTELYASMPREKAISLTYGAPPMEGNTSPREVVIFADMDDNLTHALFAELGKRDPSTLNLKLSVFPIALEEIRPYTLDRAAALLCAGFDPANPDDNTSATRVAELWRAYLSDPSTADLSPEAWASWAQANGVALPAHEACPRQIEPGIFTRLIGTLGLHGAPRAVLPNGEQLVGNFTVDQLLEAIERPTQPAEQKDPDAEQVAPEKTPAQ